jgi:hypothetical protein
MTNDPTLFIIFEEKKGLWMDEWTFVAGSLLELLSQLSSLSSIDNQCNKFAI